MTIVNRIRARNGVHLAFFAFLCAILSPAFSTSAGATQPPPGVERVDGSNLVRAIVLAREDGSLPQSAELPAVSAVGRRDKR